jgi:hypothetical protein
MSGMGGLAYSNYTLYCYHISRCILLLF